MNILSSFAHLHVVPNLNDVVLTKKDIAGLSKMLVSMMKIKGQAVKLIKTINKTSHKSGPYDGNLHLFHKRHNGLYTFKPLLVTQ